ncbi:MULTISPECIES: OsmC family protein [unclassified Neptuniibacter]|uniref:OsmC family protein n=1 Tax=unclassified Neptuniibacter TaxID=2630693 RepID=UPI000C3ADB8D|nr:MULTISPECIES: OsmC family protein [unclassified Neptuniibacter]MAY42652.1 peroxiredoxin [Oceanospirillaceae bacterium]|tara:strand:- start:54206 stop:54676 length:471 start_codon:yes stop_codon:yes gene_type:complete
MSEHLAEIVWQRGRNETYIDNRYSRAHEWRFDGGFTVPASSSPHVVPLPYSVAENVDPEEAFIASLSSCHMLFFLSIAAAAKFVIDQYSDRAVGVMGKGADGKIAITKVTLRPEVILSGELQPSLEQLEEMHHQAHEQCFLANSVKTEVVIEIMTH